MNDDDITPTTQTESTPADEPQGTPPAGGSWLWSNGAWVRNEAVEQTLHDEPAQEE